MRLFGAEARAAPRDYNNPFDTNFDMTRLGFPAYYRGVHPRRVFPSITVNGYAVSKIGFGTSSIGPVNDTVINNISNAYTAQSDVTHARAKHVLKTGFEYRTASRQLHITRIRTRTVLYNPLGRASAC